MHERVEDLDKPALSYSKAGAIADDILTMFDDGAFDAATLIYAQFQSAIAQIVTRQQLVPFAVEADDGAAETDETDDSAYDFEPSEEGILAELLPPTWVCRCSRRCWKTQPLSRAHG